jgi:hypothetical protein
MDDVVYAILPFAYVGLSIGIAIAGFLKLPSTAAGMLIGIGSGTSALISIISRVIQMTFAGPDFEVVMAVMVVSSGLQLLCSASVVVGVFQIPAALEEISKRSNPPAARW